MKYQCDRIADEIWDHAGEDLPADIAEHIAACPDCGRVADEARKLLPMMQAASCVPDAPDCRSAVMERISPRSGFRPVWAYALASVLLITVIVTGLLTLRSGPKQTVPQMVNQPKQKTEQRTVNPVKPDAPIIEKQKTVVRQAEVKRPKRVLPKHTPTQIVREAPKQEPSPEQMPAPAPEVVSYEDAPVAAVAVTWPSADGETDGWSGYTNVDTVTGEVTVCRTERSGDSVSIYLESKVPGEKPGKGA
jgi:hypothetical protein